MPILASEISSVRQWRALLSGKDAHGLWPDFPTERINRQAVLTGRHQNNQERNPSHTYRNATLVVPGSFSDEEGRA